MLHVSSPRCTRAHGSTYRALTLALTTVVATGCSLTTANFGPTTGDYAAAQRGTTPSSPPPLPPDCSSYSAARSADIVAAVFLGGLSLFMLTVGQISLDDSSEPSSTPGLALAGASAAFMFSAAEGGSRRDRCRIARTAHATWLKQMRADDSNQPPDLERRRIAECALWRQRLRAARGAERVELAKAPPTGCR
jgi:hypothetical protein